MSKRKAKTKKNQEDNSVVDNIDRKINISEIKSFVKDANKGKFNKPIESIDKFEVELDEKVYMHLQDIDVLVDEINTTDLTKLSNKKIQKIADKIDEIHTTDGDIQDIESRLVRRHSVRETWDITDHILEDILYNIPRLIKHKTGLPGCFYAKGKNKYPNDEKKAWKLGESLYNEELNKVLLYIRLYNYYASYGHVDKKDKEMVKIDQKYKCTLPRFENGEWNYKELDRLKEMNWNNIWNWMKKWGQSIWD